MRAYYIKYCKILSTVIKEARRQHYCRLIAKSDNLIKTTWNIIRYEIGKLYLTEEIPSLLINDEEAKNTDVTADAFNTFLLTITENLNLHQEVKVMPFPRKLSGMKTIPTAETELKYIPSKQQTHHIMIK
jgi:hypothetical protein